MSETEISEMLDAFASVCTWTTVSYRLRRSLVDEADRHLRSGELRFPQIQILRPEDLVKEL